MPSPLFTGVSAMMQNLPFMQRERCRFAAPLRIRMGRGEWASVKDRGKLHGGKV
jgi:hypothetical protein